jgi:hypothetical protein
LWFLTDELDVWFDSKCCYIHWNVVILFTNVFLPVLNLTDELKPKFSNVQMWDTKTCA